MNCRILNDGVSSSESLEHTDGKSHTVRRGLYTTSRVLDIVYDYVVHFQSSHCGGDYDGFSFLFLWCRAGGTNGLTAIRTQTPWYLDQ